MTLLEVRPSASPERRLYTPLVVLVHQAGHPGQSGTVIAEIPGVGLFRLCRLASLQHATGGCGRFWPRMSRW